ncbi:hypothetical protein N656DRAFT_93976 [Canariomyces notabilis]|uniref:Uncharacterized protein n=1 Tax=Canariomyces notabilis TaxID=2074819 RepID=A0AAN6YS17_9PEZI|nr:hypothetical protein N656DRAFT_93976 [Canariomyces arenarius]
MAFRTQPRRSKHGVVMHVLSPDSAPRMDFKTSSQPDETERRRCQRLLSWCSGNPLSTSPAARGSDSKFFVLALGRGGPNCHPRVRDPSCMICRPQQCCILLKEVVARGQKPRICLTWHSSWFQANIKSQCPKSKEAMRILDFEPDRVFSTGAES